MNCALGNSAFYPELDRKCVVAHGLQGEELV